jgi:hypothetical protein
MRRVLGLAIAAVLLLGGCSMASDLTAERCPGSRRLRPGNADRIDFIHVGAVTYYNYASLGLAGGRPLGEHDLGHQVAVVRCQLADHNIDGPSEPMDGDAAFLVKGTALHAVNGYRPTFRLAARRDGKLVVFEAADNPRARTWADLLDIAGRVRSIRITGPDEVGRPAGTITEPGRVARLIQLLVRSPAGVDGQCREARPYFLAFELADGTASVRGYTLADRRLDCRAPLPEAFGAGIRAALR